MILLSILASLAVADEPQTRGDALWQQYLQHFEPATVARDTLPEHGWSCGTALVAELKANWSSLTRAQQQRISARLTPWQTSLMDDEAEPPVPPPADATCWSPDGDNTMRSEHFQVEWDGNLISTAQAEALLDALEHSWDVQVGDGWLEPDLSDQYLTQVYIDDGQGAGAYTTTRICAGSEMAYMVITDAVFRQGDYYETVAAHEFNHLSQYAYGQAHQTWFFEATATWVEDSVFDDNNDWARQIEGGYTENPQLAMHISDRGDFDAEWHMYGMGIWVFFLDEHVGGAGLVREMWDHSSRVDISDRSLWQQDTLAELDIDFEQVYGDFLVNNIVMDFDEADNFGEIRHETIDQFPDDDVVEGTDQAPQSLGATYLEFETRGWDEGAATDLMLEFSADPELDWMVHVVSVTDDTVTEATRMPLEGGYGLHRIEDAWLHEDVWLVASPLARDEYPTEHYPFEWEANPVLPLRGSGLGACGCTSGPGAGWLPLVPLLLVLRRRQNPV